MRAVGTRALPTVRDVEEARVRIAPLAIRTPLRPSNALSVLLGTLVFIKIETVQPTGSFKIRGAANKVLGITADERRRGVVTVSTGNHGRAVAYAARELGARCVVCLSRLVPPNKILAIEAEGAEVVVHGEDQDGAYEAARAYVNDGLTLIDPFDDPDVVAGQGTIGLEIVEALPAVGTILVPVSGGGLAAGIALSLKAVRPLVRIVGVSSERCPAMKRSLEAGRPIRVPELDSLADSLGGGIGLDNRVSFPLVRDLVDEIRLVSEDVIAEGMRFAFRHERLVLEGGGAAALAACLRAPMGSMNGPVVALATGDNVDPDLFLDIVSRKDLP